MLSVSLGYVIHKLWERYATSCEQDQVHIHSEKWKYRLSGMVHHPALATEPVPHGILFSITI